MSELSKQAKTTSEIYHTYDRCMQRYTEEDSGQKWVPLADAQKEIEKLKQNHKEKSEEYAKLIVIQQEETQRWKAKVVSANKILDTMQQWNNSEADKLQEVRKALKP